MDGVAEKLQLDVHRLESELHDSSHSSAEGHIPHVIAGCSSVGGDGRGEDVPAFLHVVVDEILQEKLVHGRFIAIGMAGYRPVVVGKNPDRKMWGLHQRYHRGPLN